MGDPNNPNFYKWPDYDELAYPEDENWDDDGWWEDEYESDPEDDPFYYSDY